MNPDAPRQADPCRLTQSALALVAEDLASSLVLSFTSSVTSDT